MTDTGGVELKLYAFYENFQPSIPYDADGAPQPVWVRKSPVPGENETSKLFILLTSLSHQSPTFRVNVVVLNCKRMYKRKKQNKILPIFARTYLRRGIWSYLP